MHLWGEEKLFFERGDLGFPIFHTPFGRIGVAICYDGWFPEATACSAAGRRSRLRPDQLGADGRPAGGRPAMANILCMAAAAQQLHVRRRRDRIGDRARPAFRWPEPDRQPHRLAVPAPPRPTPGGNLRRLQPRGRAAPAHWNEFNQVLRDRSTDLYPEMLGSTTRPGWY